MLKIVTHCGKAHKDEFIAIAIIMAMNPNEECIIYRREPSINELIGEDVFVVDIGEVYLPKAKNFDHHQYRGGDASFVQILKYYDLYEDAKEIFKWIDVSSMNDTEGPYKVASTFKISVDDYFSMSSPIEFVVLNHFSKMEVIKKGDLIYNLMEEFGKTTVSSIQAIKKRIDFIRSTMSFIDIDGYKILIHNIKNNPTLGLHNLYKKLNNPKIIAAVIPDDRGSGGNGILRFDNNDKIDLSLLENHELISFAHKNGFVAKSKKPLSTGEIIQLIKICKTERW